jgi:hypothetical protein
LSAQLDKSISFLPGTEDATRTTSQKPHTGRAINILIQKDVIESERIKVKDSRAPVASERERVLGPTAPPSSRECWHRAGRENISDGPGHGKAYRSMSEWRRGGDGGILARTTLVLPESSWRRKDNEIQGVRN